MPSLTIMIGAQAGTTFELANRALSVGRDPSRDIQITDLKVSRKHAVIRLGETGHAIAPTKAKNGLLINGSEITEETVLSDGDELTLGDTLLRFSLQSSPNFTNAVHNRKIADRNARDANTMM
jgi:pSer/pThr/pTyr-binding forkhead associated (FHA) protein